MISAIKDKTKPITILAKDKDLEVLKSILKYFKSRYRSFAVKKYRTGHIGEDILISFRVSKEFYSEVLSKFAYNDISVIMNNKEDAQFLDQKKEEKRKKLRSQGWSDLNVDRNNISFQELEELSDQGKIKEVAKEARGGVGSKIEIITKAKELLGQTILNAIESLIQFAEEKFSNKEAAIKQLLLIASDKDLKSFQKKQEMIKAGNAAIEIALSDERLFSYLVDIANNNKIDNVINLKSSVALAGLVLSIEDNDEVELPDVEKSLNTRWLKIAFETVQQKLSAEEQKQFKDLLNYIEEKRTAA